MRSNDNDFVDIEKLLAVAAIAGCMAFAVAIALIGMLIVYLVS